MRMLILAAAVGAAALPATAASAQYGGYNGYNNRVVQEQRDCNRALRHADTRWEYDRIMRQCRRVTNYDYGRSRDDGYYGDRYSNGGRYWDGYRWRYR